ncbi:MAG: menaquinone biosynthesis protein [Coriobacteriia bacterium]
MKRPRVGHIQFLNCLPLYYGLVKTDMVLDMELVKGAPRDLAAMLLEGELDVAPIPSIEYARHSEGLVLLPDISISSEGAVQSILLLSKSPVEDLDDKVVALSDTSRTSQVLTRILFAKHWEREPIFVEMPPDLPEMMRDASAALLIGDVALRAFHERHDLLTYDLGRVWDEFTGLPMVYAVWAARREWAEGDPDGALRLVRALGASNRYSHEHLDAISEYAARWEPMPPGFFRDYFDSLRFSFDERCRAGMARFFSEAHSIGQLDRVPEIRVFGG